MTIILFEWASDWNMATSFIYKQTWIMFMIYTPIHTNIVISFKD
jgi:hypothetical protein